MTSHIFMDETKAHGYLVAAAVVLPAELAVVRRAMSGLLMPRQQRLHFTKESDARRKKIISVMCGTGASVTIYDASAISDDVRARSACLEAVLEDAAGSKAHMLVIEQDDSLVASDQKLLFQKVRELGIQESLRYEHKAPRAEPLLWIPDAVAWCWAKKGERKPRVQSMVENVRKL